MSQGNYLLFAFNRGVIDKSNLTRVDFEKTALSAEIQENYWPDAAGPMSLRPGLEYVGEGNNNLPALHIPVVFAIDDIATLEITSLGLRVLIEDEPIIRPDVSSVITNGTFDSNVTGWTDADEAGATSDWETGGYLYLKGDGTNFARRRQQVTVAVGDVNKEHALNLNIERGNITLKVGSSAGASDYIYFENLGKGNYSLAFTPTADFHIELSSNQKRKALVNSISIEDNQAMLLSTPYVATDYDYIRNQIINDIIYLWCDGYQPRKIERRGQRSWGVVLFQPEDGPFKDENISNITITPSGLSGNITLTANKDLFNSSMVGGLFKITSVGQRVESDISADDVFTDSIRITGADNSRIFTIIREGTWSATITLQRSIGDELNWENVTTYTTNGTITYDDTLDNQIIYYRIGIRTGDYTSGTAELTLVYTLGESSGIVRITNFTSSTSVGAEVLEDLGGTSATSYWNEGAWSDYRGWPTAGCEAEGRLWHFGRGEEWASASDLLESYDDTIEGDSAPITKSLGTGPQDVVNWALALQRLILGLPLLEKSNRSSSFDEPLTAVNCVVKTSSTRGSNKVQALNLDNDGIFVSRTGRMLLVMSYKGAGGQATVFDYGTDILNKLSRDILSSGVKRMIIQREPDTRIHCLLENGTVAMLVFDPVEEVKAFVSTVTDGTIEDIFITPGEQEDNIYYYVAREINGVTKRYRERFAIKDYCIGGTLNRQADSFVIYEGVATDTITGLDHLEGREVVVWADGKDLSPDIDNIQRTYLVSGGGITLDEEVSSAVIGLPYTARFKSSKLAYAADKGTALNQRKKVYDIGLTAVNTHYKGVKYGPDFDTLDPLPEYEKGAIVDADTVHTYYDEDHFEFAGDWDTDSRVCLVSQAPRPATICGIALGLETND